MLLQVTAGYYRLIQVTPGYYRWTLGYIMLIQINTGYYRLLQVTTDYYRLIYVISGFQSLLSWSFYYKLLEVLLRRIPFYKILTHKYKQKFGKNSILLYRSYEQMDEEWLVGCGQQPSFFS